MTTARRLLLVTPLYLFFMGTIPEVRSQDRGTKTGTISGHVIDANGRGIGHARVMAYPQIGRPRDNLIQRLIDIPEIVENLQKPPAEAVSAKDGFYRIAGLEKKYCSWSSPFTQ